MVQSPQEPGDDKMTYMYPSTSTTVTALLYMGAFLLYNTLIHTNT